MLDYCRASVAGSGATLSQYWTNFGSLVLFAVYLVTVSRPMNALHVHPSIHVCIHPNPPHLLTACRPADVTSDRQKGGGAVFCLGERLISNKWASMICQKIQHT